MAVTIDDLIIEDLQNQTLLDEILFAKTSAEEKSKKNRLYDKFRKERTTIEKFVNLFPGDLAKNFVRLKAKNLLGLELIDYDKIREDGYEKHDLWDLKYEGKLIEVKSSIEKYTNVLQEIINQRRIIVFEASGVKDLVIQVFFLYKDERAKKISSNYIAENIQEKFYEINIYSIDDFVKMFKENFNIVICGFETKERIENNRNHSSVMHFYKKGEKSRDYQNLFLKNAIPFKNLINELKK